ncbi:eukaryotic translation initiation factor 4 gamma-like [Lathyrus oleraceus]|uniref:eukaryotic translation initiation factor 4 gamma-like n=1 Tax=Pisum sativum TaxID=3888 RepID=UPI0021D2F270|nr:eukaryotic translation initiation factor 4 gamma-like [Pisum sativum]
MAHTLSDSETESEYGSKSDEEDEAVKKQLYFLKEELKYSKETAETLERNLASQAEKDSKEPLIWSKQQQRRRDAGIKLEERLAREAEEQARKEAEEKAHREEEQRIREAEEKAATGAAAATNAAEAEANTKAEAEEATRIGAEEAAKAKVDALTQGEHSNSGFVPLVLKTLEELQKEQQVVRARLDQQDFLNNNIQNMLSQLLQRMPPPLNP